MPKFCIDCRFFKKNGSSVETGKCLHESSMKIENFDKMDFFVTGKHKLPNIELTYCSIMRTRICGVEAKYFEYKTIKKYFIIRLLNIMKEHIISR